MLLSLLKSRLSLFAHDTRGYISVESIIVLPIMLWLFGIGWVYFDAFRQQSVAQKANYVIGDMMSRETDAIDTDYMASAHSLLLLLTQSTTAETDLRVAVVEYDEDSGEWDLVWSIGRGSRSGLTNADMPTYQGRLPSAGMDNEQLIIVETWEDYAPAFEVGLSAFEINSYSFTSPRYAPQIPFSES